MTADPHAVPLRSYFSGLAEFAFESRLGIADPPLIDYLVELLARFMRNDAIFAVRDLAGRRLEEVAQMVVEGEHRVGQARREVHRHIGDFTLFWTGVYPEALHRLRGSDKVDHFVDYCTQGKRAYRIASTLPADKDEPQGDVLERLSHDFEMCVYGLGEMRREWERRDGGRGPILVVM